MNRYKNGPMWFRVGIVFMALWPIMAILAIIVRAIPSTLFIGGFIVFIMLLVAWVLVYMWDQDSKYIKRKDDLKQRNRWR